MQLYQLSIEGKLEIVNLIILAFFGMQQKQACQNSPGLRVKPGMTIRLLCVFLSIATQSVFRNDNSKNPGVNAYAR